jgi:phosphoenolpyruvate-protein kinase (PTS system EI component)
VLDADAAVLDIDPDPAAVVAARSRMEGDAALQRRDRARAGEPATTSDGVHIAVYCNVGSAAEAAAAVELGAEGCGLLRTEFLFLDRREPPDEGEQAEVYSQVVRALGGRPLSIRTLDAGGDKPIAYLPQPHEDNPALGLRGLRTSLARPDLFATQLRAILRASNAGPCRILLPMVTEVAEVRTVREALDAARTAVGPGAMPPIGAMIETPASALLAEQLVREVDFVSIGTNDLSQYALAMDRTHPELARRLDAMHPAVLRLIACAAAAARAHGREAAVCGGLGSDPVAVPVLIGLGIRELSAVPAMIPRIKGLIRELRVADCEALARDAMARSSAADVREIASRWLGSRGLLSGAVR